ncbi:hypothetical protein F2Q70_00031347 [Brassica cretica]|uniref:Uncharacterized protein n=1 Tax=Brassica cretica TaxID=69181 RepID=A0A8S9FC76_BRACR|nr:hypothetical protein F2Q70_00031347 [Brassica cretica]
MGFRSHSVGPILITLINLKDGLSLALNVVSFSDALSVGFYWIPGLDGVLILEFGCNGAVAVVTVLLLLCRVVPAQFNGFGASALLFQVVASRLVKSVSSQLVFH